jgi:hypothetical protein
MSLDRRIRRIGTLDATLEDFTLFVGLFARLIATGWGGASATGPSASGYA